MPPTGIHEDDDGGVTIDFLIPPETEEVKPNLDAMTPAELTKFIEEQEKTHKEAQRALRALLRAKIVLAPKAEAAILA